MALTPLGVTSFNQIGPPRWDTDHWGLDRVTIPYDGYYTGLEAFLSSKGQWSACPIDGNMFLSNHTNNGDKRYPKIDLIYIGKRGGVLPPVRHDSGKVLQTLSYNAEIVDVINVQIDVQYNAPTTTATAIARTDSPPNVPDPPDTREVIYWTNGAVSIENPQGITSALLNQLINRGFSNLIITHPESKELVPNQYYQNSITKTLIWTR